MWFNNSFKINLYLIPYFIFVASAKGGKEAGKDVCIAKKKEAVPKKEKKEAAPKVAAPEAGDDLDLADEILAAEPESKDPFATLPKGYDLVVWF